MKVLAICTSPRKGGNSDILCDQFLKGAMDETIVGLRRYLRCLPGAKEKRILCGKCEHICLQHLPIRELSFGRCSLKH